MRQTRRILSAPEQIMEMLKGRLLDGTYWPEDKLPSEHELAEEFGVSRPTAREALKLLEAQHLVVAKPGAKGGYFVAHLPSESFVHKISEYLSMNLSVQTLSMAEVYEFRCLVEIPTSGLAAQHRTEENLTQLSEALDTIDSKKYPAFLVGDLAFHRGLATASCNQLLEIATGAIILAVQPILQTKDLSPEVPSLKAQLEDIYAAVAAGDRRGAEEAMSGHLQYFVDTFG